MEMLGRDSELLKIRESERHHRFELLVDSECTCMQCLYIELFGLLPQRLSNQIRFT